jgi:glycosyltransferase involved in cell wall biosynthesis
MQSMIVHTIPSIAELSSGPTHSVTRLCEELLARGIDVELSTLDRPGHRAVPGFVRRHPVLLGLHRIGASPAMHRWLDSIAAEGRLSLLHNHSLWMLPNVYPGWVAKRRGVPYVVAPRGTFSGGAMRGGHHLAKRAAWQLVQGPALEAVTCWHATAESEVDAIRARGFTQPIAMVTNAVDVPELVRAESARQTVLYLGRLHEQKRVHHLVEAWTRVAEHHPDWDLRIVGPGHRGYSQRLRQLAADLGARRISFEDALHGEMKLAALRSASLFVLPTAHENFGMAVAEALAAGTPAIVTKGAPWAGLSEHQAGWWIEHGVDSLASSMGAAMSLSPERLRRMGEAGREWMRRDFGWPEVARRMNMTYEWILSGTRAEGCPPWVDRCR